MALEPLESRHLLAGEGLSAAYFDNVDFTASKLSRVDPTVNFNWGTAAPVTGVANTTYSVRWTGAVVPQFSELYTLTVTADDGVRLWVDNELIVTNWVNQSARAVSGQIALHAGQATPIKLEYYQNTGSASVRLEWSSPSLAREVIPQARLNATVPVDNRGTALQETWTGISGGKVTDLTASAAYAGAPAYRQMITSLQSLQQDVGDATGSRIRGYIVPSFTGTHVFSVAGNDDVQFSLSTDANPANAVRVAFTSAITAPNAWTNSPTQTSSPVSLVQGQRYSFEVLHKEQAGYNHWSVGWTTPVSSAITVIGADNIEPWGATTPLPATGILNGMSTGRDRILASPEMFARAKALAAQSSSVFKTWYDSIIARADLYLADDLPPATAPSSAAGGTQPILAGLEDNLTYLTGAYRLRKEVEGNDTNAQKYFDKAKAVIQRVIQWTTWDTGYQFLGAAMVSQGISLAYDWMYDEFTAAERKEIADRVYTLAIKPTIDACTAKNYWTQWYANWSFVCIGGVGNAALAFAPEYYRSEAETLISKGWPVLQSAMQRFAGENGGWPEGPGYMGYGTLYLIRFMNNLQTAVGTDYALSLEQGFQQLPNYLVQASTNVGGNVNATFPYEDGDWSQNGDPWFYWLAQRFNRGDVAKVVADRATSTAQFSIVTNGSSTTYTRPSFQSPWALLWYDQRGDQTTGRVVSPGAAVSRTDAGFYGDAGLRQWGTSGQTNYSEHVNIWRDSWSNHTASVMFKGGYKGVDGHENLDGGTFIYDAFGTRWAGDLGRDSYSLPQVGGTAYGAYRKRAEGQNTLVLNPTANDYLSSADANERALNADQVYKDATGKPAYAPVVKSLSTDLESIGIVDLTNLYSKMRVSTVQRGFRFDRTDDSLLVQDEITATSGPEIYWFMHVPVAYASRTSQIAISPDGKTATITIGSNRLQCQILSGTGATFSLMEAKSLASSPVVAGQSSNSGFTKLTIRYTGTTNERLAVWMVPLQTGQVAPAAPAVTALASWAPRTNRQAWVGDLDGYASASAGDAAVALAAWSNQVAASTGKAAKGLDSATADRIVPVTVSIPLNPGEQVTWARLVAGVKATSGTTGASDQLYFDSTTGQTYSSLRWSTLDTSATSRELTLSAAQLSSLQDGTLNLAFSPNTTVDWVQLQYTTLDATPPTVTLAPSSPGTSSTAVGTVTIAFSEQVSGFDLADLALTRGGASVSLAGATLTTLDNKTFTLGTLTGITSTAGTYALALAAVGSGITDSSGNALAVGATTSWTLSSSAPTASLVPSATGTTATPVSSVTVTFSEAVNGFGIGDLALVRNGSPVTLASATLTTTDDRTFVLGNLLGATASSGTYQLTLAAGSAGITSKTGVPLVQSATATWTLDLVAPGASIDVSAPGTSATPVDTATITFSEPVGGFDAADLRLTRDGQSVSLVGATLTSVDGRVYSLALGTIASVTGAYELSLIGPGLGIVDALGNAYASTVSASWALETAVTVPTGTTLVDTTVREGSERIVKRGAGMLVLTVAGTFTGGTVVEEGTLVVQQVGALAAGALEVRAGATLRLDVGYGAVGLSTLVVASTARIDMGTGQLTVAAGGFDEATIRSLLIAGRSGGSWAGTAGIGSSSAPSGSNRAVGYRVTNGVLRMAWAACGDANLDGAINSIDVSLVNTARRFNTGPVAGVNWASGDYDYSNSVNSIDITLMNNTRLFGKGSYQTAPVTVTYTQSNGWSSGFNGDVTIRNTGATVINGWTLQFDLDAVISNIWNATIVSRVGTRYTITAAAWNSTIAAGAEISFGFQADGVAGESPRNRRFNGLVV